MRTFKFFIVKVFLLLGLMYSMSANAQDVQLGPDLLILTDVNSITITGPDNFVYQSPVSSVNAGPAFIGLGDAGIQADGTYTYEIKNIVTAGEELVSDPANGRENVTRQLVTFVEIQSGSFRVVNGLIVTDNGEVE